MFNNFSLLAKKFTRSSAPAPKQEVPVDRIIELDNTNLVGGCDVFKQQPIRIAECQAHLINLIDALNNGYKFTDKDIEDIFFSVNLVYNSKDLLLHRFVLLLFRHLQAPQMFTMMLTSSINQDLQSDVIFNKAIVVRYLPHIFMLGHSDAMMDNIIGDQMRFIKILLSAREPLVTSSALMCVFSLISMGHVKLVKKLVPEIRNAISHNDYSQYHAALTLYNLHKGDGTLLKQLSEQIGTKTCHSSLTAHVLIKVCSEASNLLKSADPLKIVKQKLNGTNPITQLDAARAILASPQAPQDLVASAVTRLNSLLSSPNRIAVFAALRTISKYAATRSSDFATCNNVLERLLSDSDSSLSALAAVSLLHTGFETTIDRVLPAIKEFSVKLPIDQQASLIQSCIEVTKRCPSKTETIIDFLWSTFRLQDYLEVQRAFVYALFSFGSEKKEKLSTILRYLCEYIEDSKFNELTIDIISYLAKKGVNTQNRMEIVRALNNRLLLDTADVRSSSIDALAAFGTGDYPDVTEVHRLIKSFIHDTDDEVRDRAVYYTTAFENKFDDLIVAGNTKPTFVAPQIDFGTGSTPAPAQSGMPAIEVVEEEEEEDEFAQFGKLEFKSEKRDIIESSADTPLSFNVNVYEEAIVVKFYISNELDCTMDNVYIQLTPLEEGDEIRTQEIESIDTHKVGTTYIVFQREEELPVDIYEGCLNLTILDDPQEVQFDDDYFYLNLGAFTSAAQLSSWEQAVSQFDKVYQTDVDGSKIKTHDELIKYVYNTIGFHWIAKVYPKDKKSGLVIDRYASLVLGKSLVLLEVISKKRGSGMHIKYRIRCSDPEYGQMAFKFAGMSN